MEERRPLFPPITVLLSLGRGTPRHEYHSIAQPQQREIEASFVNMKKSKLEEGPQGCPWRRGQVEGHQSGVSLNSGCQPRMA